MRRFRALRGLLALVVMMALALSTVAPAYAGTLTAASFTASTPYTYTSAQNTRYDYGFTTATTSTLSKVTMSVPAATGGTAHYLALTGAATNYAFSADSVQNSITGNIDIRAQIAPATWTPATYQRVLAKWNSPNYSYDLEIETNGSLGFCWSPDGSSQTCSNNPAATTGFAAQSMHWIRATFQPNNGAGGNTTTFYASSDGATWTGLGSPVVQAGTTAIYDGNSPVFIGSSAYGANGLFVGKVYYADIRNSIGASGVPTNCSSTGVVNCFDANNDTTAGNGWTSASANAETWLVNRSGSNLPADVASDLLPSNVTGLPAGGTANYRFMDGVATYNFTPTSVPSGTPCTVSLQGFTNTATAGSYTSTITTYDNSGPPPAAVDSVTTSALVFTADSSNTTASVTIDPSITFTVAGQASVCNGQSASNFQTGSTATAVSLGHLSPSTVGGGAQALSIADNAGGGFTVYLRTSGTTPNAMRDTNSHSIADVTGTNASPGSAPTAGTAGFGYTSGDTSTPFTSNTWAKMTNTNDSVLIGTAGTYSKSACIGYEVAVAPTTAASSYSTSVVYTAVPVY